MCKRLVLVLSVGVLGVLAIASTQPTAKTVDGVESNDPEIRKSIDRLESDDPETRKAAESKLIEDYTQTVIALEGVIQKDLQGDYATEIKSNWANGKPPDPKYLAAASAMNILGELRAARSVPLLVAHFEFSITQGQTWRSRLPGLVDYPAANALAKIGLPAVSSVVEEYKKHGKSRRFLTGLLLEKVLGEELSRAYFQAAISRESDLVKKQRLEALLECFGKPRN